MKQFYSTLFFLFLFLSMCAQTNNRSEELVLKMDAAQSYKNLAILNGIAYRENYRTINEKHPFFNGRDFSTGTVTYDHQDFNQVALRYDMFNDVLIAAIEESKSEVFIIQLINELVSSFEINGHSFKNYNSTDTNLEDGFYEVLQKTECLTVLKKQRMRPLIKRDRNVPYYEFEKLSNDYYFGMANEFINPTESTLKNLYPDHFKEINAYFKSNKLIRKNDYENFLKGLATKIEDLTCKTPLN